MDKGADRRFEKKLRWLLILVLLLALLVTGANVLLPVLAWAEMPSDKALLRVQTGSVTVTVRSVQVTLAKGDQMYIGVFDDVRVADRSLARVLYRGGGSSVLCGGTRMALVALDSSHTRPAEPSATMVVTTGQVLMDTRSGSTMFTDLASVVTYNGLRATNRGPAWYSVSADGAQVADGVVVVNGVERTGTGQAIGCPGATVPRASGAPAPRPVPTDGPPTLTPSPSDSPSASPSPPPAAPPAPSSPKTVTAPRSRRPSHRHPLRPPPPPPVDTPPTVTGVVFTDPTRPGRRRSSSNAAAPRPRRSCTRSSTTTRS